MPGIRIGHRDVSRSRNVVKRLYRRHKRRRLERLSYPPAEAEHGLDWEPLLAQFPEPPSLSAPPHVVRVVGRNQEARSLSACRTPDTLTRATPPPRPHKPSHILLSTGRLIPRLTPPRSRADIPRAERARRGPEGSRRKPLPRGRRRPIIMQEDWTPFPLTRTPSAATTTTSQHGQARRSCRRRRARRPRRRGRRLLRQAGARALAAVVACARAHGLRRVGAQVRQGAPRGPPAARVRHPPGAAQSISCVPAPPRGDAALRATTHHASAQTVALYRGRPRGVC